jgi:Uma2 family endonuclease
MQSALKTKRWTIDEYHQMIDAGILADQKVELLRGDIIEMVPEREPHSEQSQQADRYLNRLLEGVAYVRQAKPITLRDNSEPEPDISVVQDLGREYRQHHPYPENIYWLIEYSYSTLQRDLGEKLKIYAAAGIAEYWVVDIERLKLIVHRSPGGEAYQIVREYTDGIVFAEAFPKIAIEVLSIINP